VLESISVLNVIGAMFLLLLVKRMVLLFLGRKTGQWIFQSVDVVGIIVSLFVMVV
jgi:hypothetical protein